MSSSRIRTTVLQALLCFLGLLRVEGGTPTRGESLVTSGTIPVSVDLREYFLYTEFQMENGNVIVQLFPQQSPLTVENFLNYVADGDYIDCLIHRSVPGFVIQGGGFRLEGGVFPITNVPEDDPVKNEPGISNIRGTIAMAKLGSSPDSATSQWFFNLGDNSANLDAQNGGFSVFGAVIGQGMSVIDQIATIPWYPANSPFDQIPLEGTVGSSVTIENLVLVKNVCVVDDVQVVDATTFDVVLSNPDLATVQMDGSTLRLVPTGTAEGSCTISVTAHPGDGISVVVDVQLTVEHNNPPVVNGAVPTQRAFEDFGIYYVLPYTVFADGDAQDFLVYGSTLGDGTPLPAWLEFDPALRRFSGHPPVPFPEAPIVVEVTATDRMQQAAKTTFDILYVPRSSFFRMQLMPGWNLASAPRNSVEQTGLLMGYTEFEQAPVASDIPFAWDVSSRRYISVGPALTATQGYWVYGLGPGSAMTGPIASNGSEVNADVELFSGWNLIGAPHDLAFGRLYSEARSLLTFWEWDVETQAYDSLLPDDVLKADRAYWVGLFGMSTYTLTFPAPD